MIGVLKRILIAFGFSYLRAKYMYAFIILNLLPLAGVFFLDWSIAEIILLFISEIFIVSVLSCITVLRTRVDKEDLNLPNKKDRKSASEVIGAGSLLYLIAMYLFIAITPYFSDMYPENIEISHVFPFEGFIALLIIYVFLFRKRFKDISEQRKLISHSGAFSILSVIGVIITIAFVQGFSGTISKSLMSIILAIIFTLLKMGIEIIQFKQMQKLMPKEI